MRRFMTSEIRFIRDNPQMSLKLIADFLGRDYSSVWYAVKQYGLGNRLRPYKHWTSKQIKQIVEMRDSGMSFPLIAEKMGSDAAIVYGVHKRAKRAELQRRKAISSALSL